MNNDQMRSSPANEQHLKNDMTSLSLGIDPSVVIRNMGGNLKLPATTIIEAGTVIILHDGTSLILGERNTIYPNCTFRIKKGYLHCGNDVSFGPGVQIYEPRAGLEIGDNCLIASGVMICGVSHGFARTDVPIRHQPAIEKKITIEENVWIGMGAIICPGIRIGAGAVIGAGSVVTRDIPPQVVAIGSPCKVTRKREASEAKTQ